MVGLRFACPTLRKEKLGSEVAGFGGCDYTEGNGQDSPPRGVSPWRELFLAILVPIDC